MKICLIICIVGYVGRSTKLIVYCLHKLEILSLLMACDNLIVTFN